MTRPSENYKQIMKTAQFLATICGADITDPNYRMNFMTYFVILCILTYFIFVGHTIHYKISDGWKVFLEAFCFCGTVFQGTGKLVGGLYYSKELCAINFQLVAIHEEYEAKNDSYVKFLNKSLYKIRCLLGISAIIYVIIFTWMYTAPLIMYKINGKRYLLMELYFPTLDINDDFGYWATFGIQAVIIVFAGFGNFAGDLVFIINHVHVTVFSDILKLKIKELNEMLDDEEREESNDIGFRLKDVMEWHQTYSKYADEENRMFIWVILTEVVTSTLSIILTLFIVLKGDWPGAYSYFLLQFGVLYLYCGMGTLVEIANDNFCDEIYAIHWYNLTVSQQKCVLMMLMKSQDPNLVTVGGVMPLSVSTALQISKTVYSVLMMILNFVD